MTPGGSRRGRSSPGIAVPFLRFAVADRIVELYRDDEWYSLHVFDTRQGARRRGPLTAAEALQALARALQNVRKS